MDFSDVKNFLINQGLTTKDFNTDGNIFTMVKIPEFKLGIIRTNLLKGGWYFVDKGRDKNNPSYTYNDIIPSRKFGVKIIVKSDGTSIWYKTGEKFKVKFSEKFKDIYEVLEPIPHKGKSIKKDDAEIITELEI